MVRRLPLSFVPGRGDVYFDTRLEGRADIAPVSGDLRVLDGACQLVDHLDGPGQGMHRFTIALCRYL